MNCRQKILIAVIGLTFILTFIPLTVADGNTQIFISPENNHFTMGMSGVVYINATIDEGINGFEITLFNFTAGVVNVSKIYYGNVFDGESTFEIDGTINNASGNVSTIVQAILGSENSSGSKSLVYFDIDGYGVGYSPVNFTAEIAYDEDEFVHADSFGNITVHPFPPYSSQADYYSYSQINLTWSRDSVNGSDKVVIFADNSSYPSNDDPAKEIYNGSLDHYEDTGLNPGQTRYYTFWSWNNTESMFSYEYEQVTNTTPAGGTAPLLSAESPTNGSSTASMYPTLSITVTEPQGQNFNITWSTNATAWTAYNSTCTENGTYTQVATWANQSDTTYWWTVQVNDTDGNWGNATYHFDTATYSWGDWSNWLTFNYSNDPPSSFTATAYNKTQINITFTEGVNSVDSTVIIRNESGFSGTPNTPTNGTEIYNTSNKLMEYNNLGDDATYDADWSAQTFTIGTNGPDIGFVPSKVRVKMLNSATTTTANITTVNQTTGEPDKDTVLMSGSNSTSGTGWFEIPFSTSTPLYAGQNYTLILTGNGATDWYGNMSENYAGGEAYHYAVGDWYGPDGLDYMFEIYGDYIIDYPLLNGTQYCYSIWSWNITEGDYSLSYLSDCASTQSDITIGSGFGPYPANQSTENTRPPTNISIDVIGTNLDVYIYFWNMTGATDTWTLLDSWTGASSQRFEVTSLESFGRGTEFIWGNTTYYWTVNVTDGNIWENRSYWYNTTSTVKGEDARYDVRNDGTDINVLDLSRAWSRRTVSGYYPRDDLYNLNGDTSVNVIDLGRIWSHNTLA